jgi:hypothetical protein
VDIEPHIAKTVQLIPDDELRPLLAAMVQNLRMTNGMDHLMSQFPVLARHWQEPQHHDWNP